MMYSLNLTENKCSCCSCSLNSSIVIVGNEIEGYYCDNCAEESKPRFAYTYINRDDGTANLVLDDNTFTEMYNKIQSSEHAENITDVDGTLNQISIKRNGIIFVELYDKIPRERPLEELINTDDDLFRQTKLVQGSSVDVMERNSRMSDRTYIFFKTDSPSQTYSVLQKAIRKLDSCNKDRPVYFENCTTDTMGLARIMLAESGHKVVFCSGKRNVADKGDMLFPVDFTFSDLYEYCRSRIIGQDDELRKACYLVYDYMMNVSLKKQFRPASWLLTAPSGMGKTEFFRAVRDFFAMHDVPIPVVQRDLSRITEAGYKGAEADDILKDILVASDKLDMTRRGFSDIGTAIMFLDEADKKFMPSIDGNSRNFNAAAQSNLLTIVEGTAQYVNVDQEDLSGIVDTAKTMFVYMGAFQDLRNDKRDKGDEFYSIFKDDEADKSEDHFFDSITADEMMQQGMLQELAGRIAMVINFHRINESDMCELIKAKAADISRERSIEIELTPDAVKELSDIAYTPLGVRAPMNRITERIVCAAADRLRSGELNTEKEVLVIDSKNRIGFRSKGKKDPLKSADA